MTKPMTSPWAPQPKQWKKPFSSFTVKEGVFSLWKGQSPMDSRPRRTSRTRLPIAPSSVNACANLVQKLRWERHSLTPD